MRRLFGCRLTIVCSGRILRPLDGSPIYANESEFRYNQDMWNQLRNIMDGVGFSQEVRSSHQYIYITHL